jgi:hypothetical protein
MNVNHLVLKDTARKIGAKVGILPKEMKWQGWINSYTLADTPAAQYFWDGDISA